MYIPIPRNTRTYIQIHTYAYTDTDRYTYTYKTSLAHTHVCIYRYQLHVNVYTDTKREEAVQNPRSVDASATTTLSSHGFRERAAKDISLKMETELCTTKAKIPPRKAIFPVLANLSFLGWGDPWEEKRTLQLSSTLYNNILHNSLFYTILVLLCQRRKIQTRTAPKGPHKTETNVRLTKLLRDFK